MEENNPENEVVYGQVKYGKYFWSFLLNPKMYAIRPVGALSKGK